jgi:hypothetical protein
MKRKILRFAIAVLIGVTFFVGVMAVLHLYGSGPPP